MLCSGLSDAAPHYDVIVIGAGAAGMSAALFAAIRGAKTLLVEKTAFVGGTSAFSAGSIWIPNTRHAGTTSDSAENVERYLQQIVGNRADASLRASFLKVGPEAVETLERNSEVKLRAYARHPDYRSELDGAALAGRALEPLPFDGRLLGDAFKLIRPPLPEFTLLGGMMVDRTDIGHLLSSTTSLKSFVHSAKLLARHGRDRLSHGRGTRLVMGNALVGRLLYSLIRRDVDIVTKASLAKIEREADGPVTGVVLTSGGVSHEIAVNHGLILAGGGFNRHAERRAALGTDEAWSSVAEGSTGDAQDQRDRDRRTPQRSRSQRGVLGAGFDPAARRRIERGVSAFRARPRQAGHAGGRRQRAPFRQRGDFVSPVRTGNAGESEHGNPGVPDRRCRGATRNMVSAWCVPAAGAPRPRLRMVTSSPAKASSNWRSG